MWVGSREGWQVFTWCNDSGHQRCTSFRELDLTLRHAAQVFLISFSRSMYELRQGVLDAPLGRDCRLERAA